MWCAAEDLPQPAPKEPMVVLVPDTIDGYTQGSWEELGRVIVNTDAEIIVLNVRGYGGDPLILMTLISYMDMAKQQGKKIVINVIGTSASAHAFLVCQADEIRMSNGASLYFHQAYSLESFFLGFIVLANTNPSPIYAAALLRMEQDCIKKGVLTQADIDLMHTGQAIVIDKVFDIKLKYNIKDLSTSTGAHNITNIAKLVMFLAFLACLVVGFRRLK
jgi:ATP-dependent protease ClpP protease subunit